MRLFKDRAGLSPSYIHDIERGITLPSPAKLKAITSVLREVAGEQGANPDVDAHALFRAREETIYIDRLEIDPELAEVFIALRELNDDAREAIAKPILEAIELFSDLEPDLQQGMGRTLLEAIAFVNSLDRSDRGKVGMRIAASVTAVIEEVKEKLDRANEDVRPGLAVLKSLPTHPAPATRARQHASN